MASRLLVLIATDLRLHGLSVLATQAGGLAVVAAGVHLAPPQTEAALTAFVTNLNLLATLLWAEWLVSREKTKGTVAWLRTLPITDRELVTAKFCTHALWCLTFWTLTSATFLRGRFFPHDPGRWVVLLLAFVVFGGMSVATRWRFSQKLGHVLPPAVVLLAISPVLVARRVGFEAGAVLAQVWSSTTGQLGAGAALVALYLILGWTTASWVARADTYRLVE